MHFSAIPFLFALLAVAPAVQATPVALEHASVDDMPKINVKIDLDANTSKISKNLIVPLHRSEINDSVAPEDVTASHLEKRTPGCVLVTMDSNRGGQNWRFCDSPDTKNHCWSFGAGWRDEITCFLPEEGTWCRVWYDEGCKGTQSVEFTSPRWDFAGTVFNDRVRSYRCNW